MILALPLGVFVLLILHSLWLRGPRTTAIVFGWAALFFGFKGLIEIPRDLDDFPFVMHLQLWVKNQKNYGVYLAVLPLTRASFAYLGFWVSERVVPHLGARRNGFFQRTGIALLTYTLLGTALEYTNQPFQWWTWRPEKGVEPGFIHYFFTWVIWGGGFFEALFLNFVIWERVRHPWKLSLAYVVSYYVGMIAVSMTVPFLRNPFFISLGLLIIALAAYPGGPRIRPTVAARRRDPPPSG